MVRFLFGVYLGPRLHPRASRSTMQSMKTNDSCRVLPGQTIQLGRCDPADTGEWDQKEAKEQFKRLRHELVDLQKLFYADGRFGLLLVFQAMDTGGKDSTIRKVFKGVNPQGVSVASFKAPTELELRHDFLWRIHQHTPARGQMTIFNRSHYEDVLIARVKNLVPESRWKARYEHINAFEKLLADEGTIILKFYLHISKDYQKQRLLKRLENPAKHWKFDPADLLERKRWEDYQQAYQAALNRCSTDWAPWFVVPAENRWYRNLLVARTIVHTLRDLKLRYPKTKFDPKSIVVE